MLRLGNRNWLQSMVIVATLPVSLSLSASTAIADAHHNMNAVGTTQPQAFINEILDVQRDFVANELAQSSAVLSSLMEYNQVGSQTNFLFNSSVRDPAAQRISTFNDAQQEFIADFAKGMRIRSAAISGDFSEHVNMRAATFFQTGSLFTGPDLEFEGSLKPSPIAIPDVTSSFQRQELPIGGFFALANNRQ